MTTNPHKQARLEAEAAIRPIKESLDRAEANLRWLRDFDLVLVEDRLAALRHRQQHARRAADRATAGRVLLEASLADLRKAAKVGLNPFRLLSSKRAEAKRAHARKHGELAAFVAAHEPAWRDAKALESQVGSLEADLARFRSLNAVAEERARAEAAADLASAQERLGLAIRVDEGTAPLHRDLEELLRQLGRCMEGIKVAKDFEQALEGKDPYQSRRIYDACRERFGKTGRESPRQILAELDGNRARLERDVAKLEQRIRTKARQLAIRPRRVVIDGSNMCFREKELIGVRALVATAGRVAELPGCEAKVVFDQSTVQRMRMSSHAVAQRFPGGVEVVVSPRDQPADELILRLAEEEGAYVLSNDRFVDFPDRAAVRSRRVLGHSITDHMVFVADLGLEVRY